MNPYPACCILNLGMIALIAACVYWSGSLGPLLAILCLFNVNRTKA